MRTIKVLVSLLILAAVLFASVLPANAIGFDAEEVYKSVFVVYSGNSLGSGFAIGENCIVTNAHVIENVHSITLTSYEGNKYTASLLGIDEDKDIALLVIKDASFPYLKMANLSTVKIGDDIYAIGAPKGMAYTLTKGTVSAKERIVENESFIQIDAAINEGNSGGPLLNDAGEVLGMNTMKMTDSEGIGLAIPADRIASTLKELGVETDTNGNVNSTMNTPNTTTPSEVPSDTDKSKDTEQQEKNSLPTVTYAAIVIAAVSLLGNIILVILLIYQKRKNLSIKYNPKERTDFDIDILE